MIDIEKLSTKIASEKMAKDSQFLKNLAIKLQSEVSRCKEVAKEFGHDVDTAEEGWKILKAIPAIEKAVSEVLKARYADNQKTARTYPNHYFIHSGVHVGPGQYGLIAIDNKDLTGEGLVAKMLEWKAVEGGVPEAAWDDMVLEMKKKGVRPPVGIRKVASGLSL